MSKPAKKLSKHLEGKFEMVGIMPGNIRLRNGRTIDTSKATVAQAEEAVKMGCKYIKKVENKSATDKSTSGKKDSSAKS